jgi:hypothetical protein
MHIYLLETYKSMVLRHGLRHSHRMTVVITPVGSDSD